MLLFIKMRTFIKNGREEKKGKPQTEKRFAGNTAHKGLVSFIYKELPQIDKKKTANAFLNEQKTYTDTTQKGYLNG